MELSKKNLVTNSEFLNICTTITKEEMWTFSYKALVNECLCNLCKLFY